MRTTQNHCSQIVNTCHEVLMQRTPIDGPLFHLLGKNEDTELSKLGVSTNDDHLMLKDSNEGTTLQEKKRVHQIKKLTWQINLIPRCTIQACLVK